MTQDEIFEMVRQSDLDFLLGDNWMLHDELVAFANLVAAKEREACAEVCDVLAVHPEYASEITKLAAQAIRNRE